MDTKPVFESLVRTGVVPVIRTGSREDALEVARALEEGGLPVVEITMTTPGAIAVIEELVGRWGDRVIVGAGTVTDADTCSRALGAGCRFVVTPAGNPEVVESCVREEVCVIGGALTPTEVLAVWNAGATAVKVFPASVFGPRYLSMLHEPFPQIPLVPTGGITLQSLGEYLLAGAAFVGAGGDLIPKAAVRDGDFAAISRRARQYTEAVRQAREGGS